MSRSGDDNGRRRSPSPTARSPVCFECGGADHFARDCPQRKVKGCSTCGSTRHQDEGCESRENVKLRQQIAQLQAQAQQSQSSPQASQQPPSQIAQRLN